MNYSQDLTEINYWNNFIVDDKLITESSKRDEEWLKI